MIEHKFLDTSWTGVSLSFTKVTVPSSNSPIVPAWISCFLWLSPNSLVVPSDGLCVPASLLRGESPSLLGSVPLVHHLNNGLLKGRIVSRWYCLACLPFSQEPTWKSQQWYSSCSCRWIISACLPAPPDLKVDGHLDQTQVTIRDHISICFCHHHL